MLKLRKQTTGIILSCLAGAAFGTRASGQVYQAAVGSPGFETTHDIIATRDCGFQIVGREQGGGPNVRFSTARLDSNANVLWARSYNLTGNTGAIGHTLCEARNGDLILAGESTLTSLMPNRRKHILRVNSAGAQAWSVLLPGTSGLNSIGPGAGTLGSSVAEVSGQRIASISRITNVNAVIRVGVLSVVDRSGGLVFSSRYVPEGGDSAELDFAQVRNASFPSDTSDMIVVGNIQSGTGLYGVFAMRTDSTGKIIWAGEYQHPVSTSSITADGFDLDSNGDILFSGRRGPAIPNQLAPKEGIIGKIDALTGFPVWALDIDGFLNGYQAVAGTPSGGAVVAGDVVLAGLPAASVVEVDSSGFFVRQRTYGAFISGATIHGNAIVNATAWGGYVIGGVTDEFGNGNSFENYIIKTFSTLESGCQEDRIEPNHPAIELNFKKRDPQVVDDPAYLQVAALEVPLTWAPLFKCFKSLCVGDLNGDSLVEDSDFVIFANAYDALLCPTDPNLTCCPADFNHDGVVEDADFVLFASAYDALLCP